MNDPDISRFAELLDWLEGRLPPDQAQALAERLDTANEATQADLDWLRLFLQARRSVQFASPPPSVREALKGRFADHAQARQPPGLFQRWLATLTFDSRAQAATAGLRSVSDEGPQRQLIYNAESAEVAITIQSSLPNKNFIATGQVFPAGEMPADAFSIQLLSDGHEVQMTAADELGEFTFANLPEGHYQMIISADEYEVVVPALHLQS